jgi:hypothetical protein
VSRTPVGAYVCPRGVFCVETRRRGSHVEVVRVFERLGRLESAGDVARALVATLAEHGVRRADVAVAVRGFEVAHHTISLPPAPPKMLGPIIEREMRRLEPQAGHATIGWLPLPGSDPGEPLPQRHFLVASAPGAFAEALASALRAERHSLLHLTALPAALQRLVEEYDNPASTTALLAPLPDGLFLGLFLGGGMRIAIEPPLQDQESPDGAAMAEEAELGATYVRQQFRGAQLERALIAGPSQLWADTQSLLAERLAIPVARMDINGHATASLAALGAALDARAAFPLSLGGEVLDRKLNAGRAALRQVAAAAVVAAVVVGGWAVLQALDARRADEELRATLRRLEQYGVSAMPLRQTAEQRRLARDAGEIVRISAADRAALQAALVAISGGIVGPIRLDSLGLERGSNGWVAELVGTAAGASSGGAVQALHDFYRDLPRRLVVEELALDQMAYRDTASDAGVRVAFQLSFVIPERSR